jgi:hypothetical protein
MLFAPPLQRSLSLRKVTSREVPQLASFSHGGTATLAFSDVVQLQNFGSCNALDDFFFGFRNSPALITGCCYSWWLHEKFSKFVLRQCCAALQVGNLKEQQYSCALHKLLCMF